MFSACIFKEIVCEPVKACVAKDPLVITLETVSDGVCAEFALFGGLVEEEVVVAF